MIEITGRDGNGDMNVKVYFAPYLTTAPPSKPTGVTGSYHQDVSLPDMVYPKVKWVHNIEPDMIRSNNTKRYKLYRGISSNMSDPTSYSLLTTLNIHKDTDPEYIDSSITALGSNIGGTPPPLYYAVGYKIVAVDNTDQESIYSDRAKITAITPNTCSCESRPGLQPEEPDMSFGIKNFPNPFNPNTIFEYYLKENGIASLIIYDITGREVAMLLNGFKTKGLYKVEFDANQFNLSSGIYFYKISLNDQSMIKRFILLK